MENSKFIARELNLTEEEVNLAMLIGLFHDIGRFEQVRLYDTFSDKDTGLDHAAYSVKVLYEDGLIDKFIDTHEYDNIIKKAVFYHNKKVIGEEVVEMSEEEWLEENGYGENEYEANENKEKGDGELPEIEVGN